MYGRAESGATLLAERRAPIGGVPAVQTRRGPSHAADPTHATGPTLTVWREDLLEPREFAAPVGEANRIEGGRRYLDLRESHLDELCVDPSRLNEVILPPTMSTLKLHGTRAARVKIEANGFGHWLWLWANGRVPQVRGLKRLRGLRIDAVERVDLADVVRRFRGLQHLQLLGSPGALVNLSALTDLPELRSLLLVDMYGFTADEFPPPSQWPSLTSLVVGGVPPDVARMVRANFRPAPVPAV